jgi:hypothetical protein
MRELNRLTTALRDICRDKVLEEKWLLAPSLRVGFQWLDSVARSGQPALNVRVKTLQQVVLELVAPEMNGRGLSFLRGIRFEVLVDRLFERLRARGGGYTTGLPPSPGLTKTLTQAIRDLRLAGVRSDGVKPGAFEVARKGREIGTLLEAYEKALEEERLADYAALLLLATERLEKNAGEISEQTLLLVPEDTAGDLCRLEQDLLEGIPSNRKIDLPVDQNGLPKATGIFRAVGEANEVREVLRTCLGEGLPFDEVEILHTDAATYVPLIYEIASRLPEDDTGEALPVTFAEGIPARYGRPARGLLGWISWMRNGYPQSTLARMIQDGLLGFDESAKGQLPFPRLGSLLSTLTIGGGRDRYLKRIDEAIDAAERRRASARMTPGEAEASGQEQERLDRRVGELSLLRRLVEQLLLNTPEAVDRHRDLLKAAQAFLDCNARHTNRFDEYTRQKLSDEIRDLAECVEKEDVEGLDIWKWLEDKCLASPVRGERPQPGRVHVAPVHGGGHSGRKHTFVVGLDDGRFPGAGLQDPLLLDGERIRVSGNLPTSASRLARTTQGFAGLLARLRGDVTLSYCCRSLADDREMFPSPVVLDAFRSLAGNPLGDYDDLIRWLPEPVSFAPTSLDRCIDATESWVWWMCEGEDIQNPKEVIARSFPHLGRGFVALDARASDRFTEYDGHVPQAGLDFDPAKPDGPVLSASALEMAGACPMEYFFRYILGIRAPDEVRIDPRLWLDPAERGQLLHAVFRAFMHRLRERELAPESERDEKLMMETLDKELAWWTDGKPAPSRAAYEREVLDLRQACRIFLQEEEAFCSRSEPFCFEASIGMVPEGQGTPLDTLEPASVKVGGKASVRARGRIDRVDHVPGSDGKRFTVWDYKTGSSWKYRTGASDDPFDRGRLVQSALYLQLAERRLKETVSKEAQVERFGYFFPTKREHGERVEWTAQELAPGVRVLGSLCEMLAKGTFPFTDDPGDVKYSDYEDAFGNVRAAAEAVARKLGNLENRPLDPFRRLRGYDRE